MKIIKETFPKAIVLMVLMTVICGLVYPLTITGLSQVFFKSKANGSMIEIEGKQYGSELLAQSFTGEEYLWGRAMNINAELFVKEDGVPLFYGTPSNLSVTSKEYEMLVQARAKKLQSANPEANNSKVPVDLVTSSGSGLDPHISYAAAQYQVERIAAKRNLTKDEVQGLIDKYTTNQFAGIFGEKVVNVLQVNLALDGILK
jgi:K+-transporting ATPase ATPase C chain